MMTNSIAEIEQASHIILIAADLYRRQPILDLRIKKAMKEGTKIYIVNSAETELDRFAVSKITIPQYGAGMAAKILLQHVLSSEIKNPHQYEDLRERVGTQFSAPDGEGGNAFGLETTTQLQHLADEIARAKGAIILYDEMATLEPGCEDLATDLQALAVITDNIYRPGTGVGPLFKDANSLGARDMGLLPDVLPGYQAASETGMSYAEMLSNPQIKALYIMGANPARHMPGSPPPVIRTDEVGYHHAIYRGEFLIVQDIVLTETAQQADVVLPAVTFAEKEGSMTNIDHHVQAIRRALRPLPGAKADWEILVELARRLGQPWSYSSPRAVLQEIAANNPFYAGLTWEDLGLQGVRIQEQEVAHA